MIYCKHCKLNVYPSWGSFGWELTGWIDSDGSFECNDGISHFLENK